MAGFMNNSLAIRKAIATARTRFAIDRRSRLEQLPVEIKMIVICWINDSVSIFNLALSSLDYCATISIHEKEITLNVLRWYIPDELMHLAIATYEISTSNWAFHNDGRKEIGRGHVMKRTYEDSVLKFVEKFRRTEDWTLLRQHPEGLTLHQIDRYLKMHHAARYYARKLAADTKQRTPGALDFGPKITSTVFFRYERALYIMQLVTELFSWRSARQSETMEKAWGVFWFAFYPWEVEQVFCVQKLLEKYIITMLNRQLVAPVSFETRYLIARFVVFKGPSRLWGVEMGKPNKFPMSNHYDFFRQLDYREFIFLGFALPGFGLKLLIPRMAQRVNSSTCDDIDAGSMKLWYYIAIRGDTEWTVPSSDHHFFSDMRAMVFSGWALWDEFTNTRSKTHAIKWMHEELVRRYVMPSLMPGPHRVVPLMFRMTEPRQIEGYDRLPPPIGPPIGEYCYSTTAERLAEIEEEKRWPTCGWPQLL
ncbi:hypothetical protein F5Y12DRAFT_714999 [Xylaria sp. FL1777]|nr:hypothetical protein F5Y12DRAFT_714999 [Xylaria sp. FL1777]